MSLEVAQLPILRSVSPALAATYLQSTGWARVLTERARYSIWSKPDRPELLLPLDSAISDFSDRLRDLLLDLQQIEARPVADIARDIASGSCDVFRFRKHPETAIEGTIAIEDGAALVSKVKEILLLGAAAEYDPSKRTVGGRRPIDVEGFMRDALLGQTETASFVVTAQVPVPLQFADPLFFFAAGEPFERRVGIRMMALLKETREAAVESAQERRVEPFEAVFERGGSVGWLQTLVEAQEIVPSVPLEITSRWAPTRPRVVEGAVERVVFEPEMISPLREAVAVFRPKEPRNGITLLGYVEELNREAQETLIGTLAVKTTIDGRPRKVYFDLERQDYERAIQAFRDQIPISIVGDAVKEGRFWRLKTPRDLRIIQDDESESERS